MIKPLRDDESYLRGWFVVETHGDIKRAREMAKQHRGGGYTEFNLTQNQLKFLSGIVGGRRTEGFQPTMDALMGHSLITYRYKPFESPAVGSPIRGRKVYRATDAGVEALAQARAEGW